jgi:hypothetical protein
MLSAASIKVCKRSALLLPSSCRSHSDYPLPSCDYTTTPVLGFDYTTPVLIFDYTAPVLGFLQPWRTEHLHG